MLFRLSSQDNNSPMINKEDSINIQGHINNIWESVGKSDAIIRPNTISNPDNPNWLTSIQEEKQEE